MKLVPDRRMAELILQQAEAPYLHQDFIIIVGPVPVVLSVLTKTLQASLPEHTT